MEANCPGCGKHLKNLKAYETHVKRCKKLRLMQLSYDIPTVDINDISYLEAKLLPNSKDWGIWNINTNDWIKDKSGQIDSRAFQRNIRTLLDNIIAKSLITYEGNKKNQM